jgi:hypothetical protein
MDIGKPKRTYTVEPVEDPIPREEPEKVTEPVPAEAEPRQPDRIPVGV